MDGSNQNIQSYEFLLTLCRSYPALLVALLQEVIELAEIVDFQIAHSLEFFDYLAHRSMLSEVLLQLDGKIWFCSSVVALRLSEIAQNCFIDLISGG
jgi:hypothetical protein